MPTPLTTTDHNQTIPGLTYVYPVMSRRAGGLSIGINVNTNNACNWRCLYCQVPNLRLGAAPDIDFARLRQELQEFLNEVFSGDFYARFQVEPDKRIIKDIAISGNGEPTTSKEFLQLVTMVGEVAMANNLLPGIKLVLITNGSLIHLPQVQRGLSHWHSLGGEVWFKLDSATPAGRQRINNTRQSDAVTLRNLRLAISLCTTKIQTCLLSIDGNPWSLAEQQAYLNFLKQLQDLPYLPDIMLYTLARPSYQPEANRLAALTPAQMQHLANALGELGHSVSIY